MTLKYFLPIIFFTLVFSCAKLPVQQSKNNDKILSGGSDVEKPNTGSSGGTTNPDGEIVYPENSALYLGMPSMAKTDAENSFNNYLLVHSTFVISYNHTKDIPNWVAWHLVKSDTGSIKRSNAFAPDPFLPFEWIWVDQSSYVNTGFNKGHNCPSADRTAVDKANIETFYMTNMIPQASKLNSGAWSNLETDIRKSLIMNGTTYEAYIYNGCLGIGGKGDSTIRRGFLEEKKIINRTGVVGDSIWVPKYIFKIVVLLPEGNNDSLRIMTNNGDDIKVLAVLAPNTIDANSSWQTYITDIKSIEDSIIKYKDIEGADKYLTTNSLNPAMFFLGRIPNGAVKDKLKTMKWVP